MARYEYECSTCLQTETIEAPLGEAPATIRHDGYCGGLMRRVFDFQYKQGMREHYNPSLGRYVRGQGDFRDGLKRASDNASERTGMFHDYQPVDLRDKDACGVTDEGLDRTAKVKRDSGAIEPARRIIA